ncbi:bacteriophage CI repressor [Avibacterium paragallinarum]|nr:bacteriophage CI repressor [Avibacterium paragallinarum]RZN68450.1 helix-turn-helix domain-containing protein [Avibacterium paragallinarum]
MRNQNKEKQMESLDHQEIELSLKDQLVIQRLEQMVKEIGSKIGLAKIADVSPQAVNNWFKNGKVSVDSALKLHKHFGYPVEWILGKDNSDNSVISGNKSLNVVGTTMNGGLVNQVNNEGTLCTEDLVEIKAQLARLETKLDLLQRIETKIDVILMQKEK